jgi:hypothetical protein
MEGGSSELYLGSFTHFQGDVVPGRATGGLLLDLKYFFLSILSSLSSDVGDGSNNPSPCASTGVGLLSVRDGTGAWRAFTHFSRCLVDLVDRESTTYDI